MFASSLDAMFNDLTPDEIFPYAPPQGIEELRDLCNKNAMHNPELSIDNMSLNSIAFKCINTWFILVGDLFVNQDTIRYQSITGVITNLFSIREMVQTFKHILSLIKTDIILLIH